jgi:3D (Asp-Asp-Asp) domain-containing protein
LGSWFSGRRVPLWAAALTAASLLFGSGHALAAPAPSPATTLLIQAELRDLGSSVALTGAMDAATRAAIAQQGARTVGQLAAWTAGDDPVVLRPGDTGRAVAIVQRALNDSGPDVWAGPADGVYGPRTADAVRAFQRDNGLGVTGVVNLPTLKALVAPDPDLTLVGTRQTLTLVATAYGPSRHDNFPYGAVDYFGRPLQPGDVAVDPSVIPLGTHLWISGYHSPYLPAGGFEAVAVDTGGAIQGNRIDIFIDGGPNAVASFGIQRVTVTVLP